MSNTVMACPYNPSHVVTKLRMAKHLVKCKDNFPNSKLAICFYDFLHRVPHEKLKEHIKVCPSKDRFETRFCFDENIGPVDTNSDIIYVKCNPWKMSRKILKKKGTKDSEGHKREAKDKRKSAKSSEPKEECWDTPSSEDSDDSDE